MNKQAFWLRGAALSWNTAVPENIKNTNLSKKSMKTCSARKHLTQTCRARKFGLCCPKILPEVKKIDSLLFLLGILTNIPPRHASFGNVPKRMFRNPLTVDPNRTPQPWNQTVANLKKQIPSHREMHHLNHGAHAYIDIGPISIYGKWRPTHGLLGLS